MPGSTTDEVSGDCDDCGRRFFAKPRRCDSALTQLRQRLNLHRQIVHDARSWVCDQCSSRFTTAFQIYQHIQSIHHHKKRWFKVTRTCDNCCRPVYYTERAIGSHFRNCNAFDDRRRFGEAHPPARLPERLVKTCDECGKTPRGIALHWKIHHSTWKKPFSRFCDRCLFRARYIESIIRHVNLNQCKKDLC